MALGRLLGFLVGAVATIGAACDGGEPPIADQAPVPARVRLITDAQYGNVVRDLLGDVTVPPLRTPGTAAHQFIHEDVIAVDAPLLVQYRIAAEVIAAELAADAAALGCPASDGACARARVEEVAGRAFRRPLDGAEAAALWSMFELGRADGGEAAGFALVIEAVLQAPDFLYRSELGPATATTEVVELSPHELAAELSFLLLDSIPDPALWAAAGDGSLADPDVLAAQVDRLLALPRVQDHLVAVALDWLEVWQVLETGKDPLLFPDLDPGLRVSMFGETERFVRDVLWRRRGSLRDLLGSRASFADARLAAHYGLPGPSAGAAADAFVPIDHDPQQRAGILTHASLLTSLATARQESIIRRGIFIHRHLLCTPELGRPPFDAIAGVAPLTSQLSESQFAHYRAAHLYCRGCHRVIDPPGRALHHFDGLGRWRAIDPIDQLVEATARLLIGDDVHDVDGAVELAAALADSEQVARCVVDQLAHHAFGQAFTDQIGAATRRGYHGRFEDSDRDLVDVFRTIATSPAFRKRHRGGAP